jgi:hypothetical protein
MRGYKPGFSNCAAGIPTPVSLEGEHYNHSVDDAVRAGIADGVNL